MGYRSWESYGAFDKYLEKKWCYKEVELYIISLWPSDALWWLEICVNLGSGNGFLHVAINRMAQSIAWSNNHLSSVKTCGIHMRAVPLNP